MITFLFCFNNPYIREGKDMLMGMEEDTLKQFQ